MYGLFFRMWHPLGGMRTPDQGSTTGNASWTDRARSKRAAPQGRAKRVNPPSPPYFKKSSYACTGFFFASNYYAPQSERSIIWNDPEIGIDWPALGDCALSLSEKDLQAHTLATAEVYK
ncbi:hypothetical protein E3AUHO_50190 [Klebsiella pneumoniae subsp. pneumoniae]|nr:hypothetical protein E3AUHO_50190 [Klebsiella pneumoniae subsp. pneumoniae]